MSALFGLTRSDRRSIAEGIIALGNLVFAALTLGQTSFLGGKFDPSVMVAGIVFWLLAYLIAILIMRGGD